MIQYNNRKKRYFFNKKTNLKKKLLVSSNLHIHCNIKNTLISLTKKNGNLLKQWSTKSLKKTKFKKNTPYNIQFVTNQINKYIKLKKIKKLDIFFKGNGPGRKNVLQNLKTSKKKRLQVGFIKIGHILDKTKIPFNGCRRKKMKRR